MVDVAGKEVTDRRAVAEAELRLSGATLERILAGTIEKGDVLAVARVAGIQAAKRTAELIPLCHHLALSSVSVAFGEEQREGERRLVITAEARATDRTGVEMEALTAAAVAALTVYDMCKAVERGMEIRHVRLLEKRGGRSGAWTREAGA
jgi:cyclic pyranopterin phosphate synthase